MANDSEVLVKISADDGELKDGARRPAKAIAKRREGERR
jgi:hypothetical protein